MIKREFISKSGNLIKNPTENLVSGLNVNNLEELTINLKTIRELYGNRLKIDSFDERLFLVNNMKDNSPVKLTPFKKQGHHNFYFKVNCFSSPCSSSSFCTSSCYCSPIT
jgi:LPS O-antigen subunit length determinant protein (WzzB/FepE family)